MRYEVWGVIISVRKLDLSFPGERPLYYYVYMATLFVAAAAAADPSLDVRIGANNKAAEAKLQAGIDEQAPLASTPDDMQVLWELVKSNRAVEAKLKARADEQAAQIGELTQEIDALMQPKVVAVTAAGQQVLEQAAQGQARRLDDESESSASCCRRTNDGVCGVHVTEECTSLYECMPPWRSKLSTRMTPPVCYSRGRVPCRDRSGGEEQHRRV